MVGEQVVLVNRTRQKLNFMADGRSYSLKPGKNYGFLDTQARFAKAQNPLMGTEDYLTLEFQSLVGVEGVDECDEIPQEVLDAAKEAERFDIATMTPASQKNRRALAARLPLRKGRGEAASLATANASAVGE